MLQDYHFILRTDYKRANSEEYLICLRFFEKRKRKLISLGISTEIRFWDEKKCLVKAGDPRNIYKNKIIAAYNLRANKIILDHLLNNKKISASIFIEGIKNNYDSNSFFDFMSQIIKEKKSSVGEATFKNYGYQINKLRTYRKNFSLSDIDLSFIRGYQAFLKDLGNGDSTQSKSLAFLRMICLEAVKHDVLTKTPFLNFKIKEVKGKEEYLTFNELIELEKLYKSEMLPANKQNVLRYFLFACYTGIAHGDLSQLKFSDIKKIVIDKKEFLIIDNERIKTGTRYRVPLIQKATDLLGRKFQPYQKLFRVLTNQPTNRYLKEIAKDCKIKTNVTFHLARHTFGTHGTSLGIPENFIMEMMGHKDKKVSRMYSKIQDAALVEMMNKSQILK